MCKATCTDFFHLTKDKLSNLLSSTINFVVLFSFSALLLFGYFWRIWMYLYRLMVVLYIAKIKMTLSDIWEWSLKGWGVQIGKGGGSCQYVEKIYRSVKKGWVGVANGPKKIHRRFRKFFPDPHLNQYEINPVSTQILLKCIPCPKSENFPYTAR